jgi:CheY-like chemotaxis protein
VTMMGGRIHAKGALGEGATFSFTIPLEELAPPLPNGTPEEMNRILLVTGHDLVGDVLAEQIRYLGHQCVITPDVKEAERLLTAGSAGQQEKWDAVALDPATLTENVYFILARIEESPSAVRPKVFLLSQLVDKPQYNARWTPYVAGILPRPVRAGRLAALLEGASSDKSPNLGDIRHTSGMDAEEEPEISLNVLLAEDNLFNQKVACGMLRRLGCEVSLAVDGVEAVDQAEKGEFDLIFMDCQMPNMDGYEASRSIRQLDGARSKTPIIAITANAFREDRDACMAAGMDDFLTKPVKKEQLAQVISKWAPIIANPEPTLI